MKEIDLLELFSGIGGFSKGIEDAGFKISKHQFSEIDKHAIANYKYNFKNAEYIGSVTDVRGQRGQADIITFGSPCQDFSLAGKQTGLNGKRSVLILEAIRLISEIRPSVFVWENVKGTFSSNDGADFWAILAAFTNIRGYRLEWQLLNTDWFLPQNRERIYLVGHLAGRSIGNVFPIRETNPIHFKNNRDEKPRSANCLDSNYGKGWLDHGQRTHIVQPVLTPDRKEKRQNGRRFKEDGEPAFTLNCQDQHGICITHYGFKNKEPKVSEVAPTLKAESHGHEPMTITDKRIRRLTEIECERLQGFPDDWTKYGIYDGVEKKISKTQRYKMLGNAVTVNVVKEVFSRINIIPC